MVSKLLATLRAKVDDTISVQKLQVLLLVASEPGITQLEIAQRCDLSRSAASKNAADLGKWTSKKVEGPDLIKPELDPRNPMVRTYQLTPRGKKIIAELFG